MKTPDPKWHYRISLIKSGLRIGAGLSLIRGSIVPAGILLIAAEAFGVLEEIV